MYALYENTGGEFSIYRRKAVHEPPHITGTVECIYVTEGRMTLGVNADLFSMEKGDFAVVFPDVIHHYQVFQGGRNYAIHAAASPYLTDNFMDILVNFCPVDPVIKAADVHPDIPYIMTRHLNETEGIYTDVIFRAGLQIILSRTLPLFTLVEKTSKESDDLIDRTVSYIARHFAEPLTLTSVAQALYVSPYTLSRIFSGTFHTNFNQYLNRTRLRYVTQLLKYTNQTITEAYLNAGFESQRTFNRAFREQYRMTPREYKKRLLEELAEETKR